jgi:hypothetical protein
MNKNLIPAKKPGRKETMGIVSINYGAENIDDFIEKLQKYTLDPTFEKYGNFIKKNPKFPKNPQLTKEYKGWYMLFGNFYDYSNAFSIYIKDEKLAGKIRGLIRKNQRSEEYQKAKNEILEREKKLEDARIKRLNDIIG